MHTWSLDDLYQGFNESFDKDVETLTQQITNLNTLSETLEGKEDLHHFLTVYQDFAKLSRNLGAFISLNLATDSSDAISNQKYGQLSTLMSNTARPMALFKKFVLDKGDQLDAWKEDSLIKEHEFILEEIVKEGQYQLSDEVEDVIAKMQINASDTWSKLQTHLTANATIEFQGETQTISSIRKFAYDHDQEVRKAAYLKELELYKKIEDPVVFSLNSIKGEVNTIVKLRGYEDSLEETLMDSRLSRKSLDALFLAMEESLPSFRKFLKHKAKLLGHEKGLPWYDLFAPMETENPKSYTIEESKEMILNSFTTFSPDLKELAERAYDEKWIDFLPREGKRDGAFCSNLPQIKQSRVLTNYDGSISDIITIAHELGHAYHGHMIEDLSILNTGYTMPVAETASTFCENIVFNAAMKTASKEEKLVLIENSLTDLTQIIVDISSRYQFEKEVLERRHQEFLFADDLKDIMIKAQKNTYGDGLDQDTLHPYMWVCKGHYYNAGLSFYNFPYAFGGLFALGLYAQYEVEGESFVPKYQNLLTATTTASCEDTAKLADIDTTDPDFWRSSLKLVEDRINDFIELSS